MASSTRGVYLCHQCHVRGECQQPGVYCQQGLGFISGANHLTLTPGLPVKLPLRFIKPPLILSPMDGLRCWVVCTPLLRVVVVPRVAVLLEARGPLPA